MRVCLAVNDLLRYTPHLGGHAWVFINWALGLQANGSKVTLLERLRKDDEPGEVLHRLRFLQHYLSTLGLRADFAFSQSPGQQERYRALEEELKGLTVSLQEVIEESELLLNFRYVLESELVSRFKRSALVDIDPGLLQVWISEGQLRVAPHDIYFTIGETVGTSGALFPDCDLQWHYTPPGVYLPAWPSSGAEPGAAFTGVTNWWGDWVTYRGEHFDNQKRTSYLQYLSLPSQTTEILELALYPDGTYEDERRLLESSGWRVRQAPAVASTPEQYRTYIRQSRGEFGCAKPSCMRFQNAWISDRTLCYLASGKPAVVQHTGPSRFLPDAEGLFRFRNSGEAAAALAATAANYEQHCRSARALAKEYFDAVKVAASVLERALAVRPRRQRG